MLPQFVVTAMLCVAVLSSTTNVRADELAESIPTWLSELSVPSASVAVLDLNKDQEPWTASFGNRTTDQPADMNTRYTIASLTKPVFAAMIHQLIGSDQLKLDQSLSDFHVDEDLIGDERHLRLTPRILLSHQSGFPNWRGDKDLNFEFEPGTRLRYSGEGYNYLMNAAVSKTATPLRQLMKQHVFDPIEMDYSALGWKPEFESNVAIGFDGELNPMGMDALRERGPNAASNMFTTIGDFAKFAKWVLKGADLPADLSTQIFRPQVTHDTPLVAGLGWFLIPSEQGVLAYHSGIEVGHYTMCVLDLEAQQAVVVLTNGDNGELVARRIIEHAIPRGLEFNQHLAGKKLKFLRYMSEEDRKEVVPAIIASPAHMETMFLAIAGEVASTVDNELVSDELAEARNSFARFIVQMRGGGIDAKSISRILDQIIVGSDSEQGLQSVDLMQFRKIAADARRILGGQR